MKKAKVVLIMALAVAMVLSVSGIGFAAGEPDIGGGAQAGTASSNVTLALSAQAPVSISATVPITIPLAVQVNAAQAADAPQGFAPTDCKIINNSKNLGTNAPIAIDITNVTASIAPGADTWSLMANAPAATATTTEKNKLYLGMCGGHFGLLDVAAGGVSSLDTVGTGFTNLAGETDTNLAVNVAVGGTNGDYTGFADGVAADVFKVQFTIAEHV